MGLARKQVVLESPMCPLLSGDIRSLGSDTCFMCSHSQFLAGPPWLCLSPLRTPIPQLVLNGSVFSNPRYIHPLVASYLRPHFCHFLRPFSSPSLRVPSVFCQDPDWQDRNSPKVFFLLIFPSHLHFAYLFSYTVLSRCNCSFFFFRFHIFYCVV